MEHIVEFLRSMDEQQMAEEVYSASSRLNAFAAGLDRDCFDAQVKANESLLVQLAQYKADAERWNLIPRFAEDYQIPLIPLFDAIDSAIAGKEQP